MIIRESTERSTETVRRRGGLPIHEAGLIVALVVWNVLAFALPAGAQLPISAVGVVGLVVIARRAGLGWTELGLARRNIGDGVRVGVISAGVLVLVLITSASIPFVRDLLADGRFVGMELPRVLYEMLVRIPLAVAVAEEVAFRGVLLGMLMRRTTTFRAVVASSVLFGFWHVLPGIAALGSASGMVWAPSLRLEVLLVAVQVLVTGLAGGVFSWLRLRGRHVVSPILVHAPLNSVTFAIGWLAVQSAWF